MSCNMCKATELESSDVTIERGCRVAQANDVTALVIVKHAAVIE